MQGKVLFINHYSGRTGAPLLLLNMLDWFKGNTSLQFEVLLMADGALTKDFAKLAPLHFFQNKELIENKLFDKTAKFLGIQSHNKKNVTATLLSQLINNGISLIYSNTITTGSVLKALAPLGCPVITHVHELDYWINHSGKKNFDEILKHSDFFIAASDAVKRNLVEKYSIRETKIDVVHSFIPTVGVSVNPEGVREALGIPDDAFVVLGSGHETWRKGKDLFVQLAALTVRKNPNIRTHFLWVGGWQKDEDRRSILHDVGLLGLTERIHFVGEVKNPLDYFAAGDVFAMVSREDPFPLVCLEAALLEKPILCFESAGGMPEFVEGDAGYIVPYLDITDMAGRIAALASDNEIRYLLGKRASMKVHEHFDISIGAKNIEEIIHKVSDS